MSVDAEKILLSEIHKLSPLAQDAARFILNKLKNISGQDDLPEEIWRDVNGYEGLYKISNFGRVKSFHYGVEKFLKLRIANTGYSVVGLSKRGFMKEMGIHILVAKAFVENPGSKPFVNHIDGNKSNNHADNLEWVTNKENIHHAWKSGLIKPVIGTEHHGAKLSREDVIYIRKNYKPRDKTFGAYALAKEFNVSKRTIEEVAHNKRYNDVSLA